MKDDRAVSEMVDYSIILSIILLATAIITVAGVPMLKHMQETQHTENMEQSFQVLAMNINKVVFGNAPSQSVELKMYGGSLYSESDESSNISITMKVWDNSTTFRIENYSSQMGKLESDFQGTLIGYENSGVWARYSSGDAVMLSEPRITCANNVIVIPDASIFGTNSISGSGLVRITADSRPKSTVSYQNVSQMNVTITSDYVEAWEGFLTERLNMTTTENEITNRTAELSVTFTENVDVYFVKSYMDVTIN
jgi:hypothetical protein